MSQENVGVVRRGIDAFNRGDRAAFLAVCDPDYENVPPGDWPEAEPIRGREAIWDFFVQGTEPWEEVAFEVGELIEVGDDRVVFEHRAEMKGAASGATVPWRYWVVTTFRDGKARRSQWFNTRVQALEAAGLEE